MKRLTTADLKRIAENVDAAARDNARHTAGVPKDSDGLEFLSVVISTGEGICDSYLTSERDFSDYAPQSLTRKQADTVLNLFKARYDLSQIREAHAAFAKSLESCS